MSAGEDADQGEPYHLIVSANDAAEGFFQLGGFIGYGYGSFRRH
jgi:hypothetical protein